MQKTDSQLITEANIIRNETVIGANTALRVGTMFDDMVDSKINNDKIDTNTALGTSDLVVPSQKAVKSYVDGVTTGLLNDRGNYDASTNLYPAVGGSGTGGTVKKGDIWYISVPGTLGATSVLVGYSVRALVDNPGQIDANWAISNVGLGYVPEDVNNKSNDVNLGTSTSYYPTQNAVKTYVDTQVAAAVPSTAEVVANKSQDIVTNPTSTVLYPSNKAVADYIAYGVTFQAVTNSGNSTTNDIHIQDNVISADSTTDATTAYLKQSNGDSGIIGVKTPLGKYGEIKGTNITNDRTYQLPDNSGTIALISDIPNVSAKPEYRVRVYQAGTNNPVPQATFIDTITTGTPYVSPTWTFLEFIRVSVGTYKLRLVFDLSQNISGFNSDLSFSDNKLTNTYYSQISTGTEKAIEFLFYRYDSSGTLVDGINWTNVYLKLW